jgi:polyphosphate kinase
MSAAATDKQSKGKAGTMASDRSATATAAVTAAATSITAPGRNLDDPTTIDAAEQTIVPEVSIASSSPLDNERFQPRQSNGRYMRVISHPAAAEPDGLPGDRFLDREVSWLQFNERVLQLAADDSLPLLERARFLAIFASNLDEFFMVRVAGLKRRIATGMAIRSASGLEPREVLEQISLVAHELMGMQSAVFHDLVRPALQEEGISIVRWEQLSDDEQGDLQDLFTEQIFPVLTPLAVDPAHPFPYISGLSLNLAVVLINPKTGKEHFARVKVPPLLPRFLLMQPSLGDSDLADMYGARFVPLEDVIAAHLDQLFPGMEVHEHYTFRVTRNEDLEVEEDDAENLLAALEKELIRRRFGPPVRLEVDDDMDDHVMDMLVRELGVHDQEVYRLPTPLDLTGLNVVADLERWDLHYERFVPRTNADLAPTESAKARDILGSIRRQDVLLQHPYDAFSTSVQEFIEQAAADPKVLAIKQTLYRTSGDSPIIDALIDAAEAGKQVLAVVEIKARFDEENNISWARKLEHAGVHVVYGIVGLKTHAKLCLVVRQEPEGLRRYCHIGTGNYNPKTARLYEDLGLLTTDPQVGEDLSRLFNQLSGLAPRSKFRRLLVAPRSVRSGLIERIEAEASNARRGRGGYVGMKLNSIVDEQVIDALYRASRAGVTVQLWVRGICALRPGVEGLSENIEVRSILGRFLEHSRIFYFGGDGEPEAWIGSADMMHRNLDRRVEALVRIDDARHIDDLRALIDKGMGDQFAHWRLSGDGRWTRAFTDADGQPLPDLQEHLIGMHAKRRRKAVRR